MSYNDVNYEWTKKGGTLSDKTAFEEFGLTQDDVITAINEGKLVICNRYTPSSIYQAAKIKPPQRKKFLDWVETLEYEVFGIPRPNLVIFLYVPFLFSQILIVKKQKDQYEKNENYLKKVEFIYLETLKNNKNWVKVDCVENGTILSKDLINKKITNILNSLIPNL